MVNWDNLSAVTLDRKGSDHCPTVLKEMDLDFGPKPVKAFDFLLEDEEIENSCKKEVMRWEVETESRSLNEEEVKVWMEARKVWLDKENGQSSILNQEARLKWDVEGDENSRFFHNMVKRRCDKNKYLWDDRWILVRRSWEIKDEILDIYKSIFSAANSNRCGNDKAPRPHGFNLKYIKRFLGIIKEDVLQAVVNPLGLDDFRPISLIVSIYKIIAVIVLETKEDERWRKWVMACLRSASISILVHRSPKNEFYMGHGVWQGDPSSPFLFILAVEGLNALLAEAVDKSIFKRTCVGKDEVARLKINLRKSKVYGVGVDGGELNRIDR
ncbi:hypothetical protein Tco_1021528, partial [Tanacetum coccineum]